jgi:Cu/Zn superoxide dismutase
MKRNRLITHVTTPEMMLSRISVPLLLWMALLCSSPARAQLAVAFFDDFGGLDPRQSYLVSTDGRTLEGEVMVKYRGFLLSGSFELKICETGDIASQSNLDECKAKSQPFLTNGITCSSDVCSVKLQSVPIPYNNFCDLFGKAILIDFFQEPGHVIFEPGQTKAVFGFGNVTSADCPFARNSAAAIVKMKQTEPVPGQIRGTIIFQQLGRALSVSGFVTGLSSSAAPYALGMHLHTFGDIRDNKGASTTGMHFMFPGQQHGLVNNTKRHTGDLGNIVTDVQGNAAFNILVPLEIDTGPILTLLSQDGSAIGRSVILHERQDDGVTQPTGNSGSRIAQGVVGSAKNVTTTDIITLLNQEGFPQGFYCACTLCSPAGVEYAGFCLKSDCNLPPPKCSPPPPPTSPASPVLQPCYFPGIICFL